MGLVEPATQLNVETLNRYATTEPPVSDDELIRERATRGLEDIYYYETEILDVGKDDEFPRDEAEIRPMLEWFDQLRPLSYPPQKRLLIYWSSPRFTAKTFCLATKVHRSIVQNPNIAIMIMCELKEMAVATIDMIRAWFEMDKVIQCYGVFKPRGKGWGGEAMTVAQRTVKRRDPTLLASGMDVPMQGWHPDMLIWDDLVGETNNHLAGYKKVSTRVAASMPVLRQGGTGIFNGTRWGEEDPAGEILEKASKKVMWIAPPGRGFFGAEAVESDKEFYPHAVPGEPLFPTILPTHEIDSYRLEWPWDLFSSQILNDPAPIEGRYFHQDNYQYFEPYKKDPQLPVSSPGPNELIDELKEGFAYMAIDAAGGKAMTERGDDTAIGCGFVRWVGPNAQLWMVEAVGGRWKPDKVIDEFFTIFHAWRPVKVYAEVNILKNWLLDPLQKRANSEGFHLPIEEVNWGRGESKNDRIQVLAQPYTYRQVFHANNLKNSKLEIQQARWQPGGKSHDDFVDMEATIWIEATKKRRGKRRPGSSLKVAVFNRRPHPRYKRTGV